MVVAITKENFNSEIKSHSGPIILDIYASWCGPCQMMTPIFEELEQEFLGKCKFAKLNVDEARELAIEYGVTSIPTFVFIKNGNVVKKEMGQLSKKALKEKIDAHIAS
ncbi:MAG: lpbca thioredoxin [candidate division TM6 bacterium GW2011_GWF2_32_72]|nr:MAG: lpbca thioredoxin [candidate division TM6 bacterium GW2011_GWF2_32_72]